MKIAMISYNMFVDGESNGWKKKGRNRVLLLQNSTGKKWGTTQTLPGSRAEATKLWEAETAAIVDPLWEQLKKELATIDKVVFYVGSDGAERVIELARENGLTPERAIFVMCDCNMGVKMGAVRQHGFSSSQIVNCSCGGHDAMRRIYDGALAHGSLPG